jgi:HEAT repeat protein
VASAIVTCEGPGASPEVDAIVRQEAEPCVWIRCVEALKERRTPEDHRYLASLVADRSVPTERRVYVARAFDGDAIPEVVPELTKVLVDGEAQGDVLLAVAESVGKQAPDGLAHRLRGLLEPSRPVTARVAVARALRFGRDREGLDDVRGALAGSTTPPPELRVELAAALGELGGRADVVQLETLRDRDPDESVRMAAAEALARLEELLAENPDR